MTTMIRYAACCFLCFSTLVASAADTESKLLLRAWGYSYQFDEKDFYAADRHDSGAGMLARLMLDRSEGNASLSVALQYAAMSDTGYTITTGNTDIERSSAFSWRHENDSYSAFDLDRLHLDYQYGTLSTSVGRMAVNLSRTFYFSPNDFFAPFAANNFYREHKAGVDAVRMAWEPVELTRVSLLSVEGYTANSSSSTGWSVNPSQDRRSYLAILSTTVANAGVEVMAAHVRDARVWGASLQTSLADVIDVRAEGHVAAADADRGDKTAEWAIGLGYRPSPELDMRLEVFRHGKGQPEAQDYVPLSSDSPYLARHYAALGFVYQWSAITTLNAVAISNLDDDSGLLSAGLVRSLSDESDLDITVSVPYGKRSETPLIRSEYGLYPVTLGIEWRSYF